MQLNIAMPSEPVRTERWYTRLAEKFESVEIMVGKRMKVSDTTLQQNRQQFHEIAPTPSVMSQTRV